MSGSQPYPPKPVQQESQQATVRCTNSIIHCKTSGNPPAPRQLNKAPPVPICKLIDRFFLQYY